MFPTLCTRSDVIRRGPGEVQVGLDPVRAVVVTGLSEDEISVLEHLDGSLPMSDIATRSDRLGSVVGDLLRSGVVADAHAVDVSRPRVGVSGHAPVVHALSQVLQHHRLDVVTGIDGLAGVEADVRPVDLVVLAVEDAVAPEDRHLPPGVPVLPVIVQRTTAQVGPLVRGTGGVCLLCLDLTRADLDPAWGNVLAQTVLGAGHGGLAPSPLAFAAAGIAASMILAWTQDDGSSEPTSVSLSLTPARLVERRWSPHPRCPHHPRPPEGHHLAGAVQGAVPH